MKIGLFAPKTKLSDSLRRCAHEVFASSLDDFSQTPRTKWKESIAACDVLFIDATAGLATTSYLAGIAEGLGKRTILLTPVHELIPEFFGPNPSAITHQWNFEDLKAQLELFARGPLFARDSSRVKTVADDTPSGKFHELFGDLLQSYGYTHRGPVEFDGSTFTVREQDMDFALVQEIAQRAKSLNMRVRLL